MLRGRPPIKASKFSHVGTMFDTRRPPKIFPDLIVTSLDFLNDSFQEQIRSDAKAIYLFALTASFEFDIKFRKRMEAICFLVVKFFKNKKYRGINEYDGGNIPEMELKIAGGVIGSGDEDRGVLSIKMIVDVGGLVCRFDVLEGLVAAAAVLGKRRGHVASFLPKVHSTFHVSNLKKCLSDEPLAVPLDEIHIDDKLHFVEEPVEILEREIKKLRRSRIPIIKVRWNSKRGPEFTWEREDQFRGKYPHLFTKTTPSKNVAS
ncbi:hypothetical protein Tco_0103682 [Tanacetum coccineum]